MNTHSIENGWCVYGLILVKNNGRIGINDGEGSKLLFSSHSEGNEALSSCTIIRR